MPTDVLLEPQNWLSLTIYCDSRSEARTALKSYGHIEDINQDEDGNYVVDIYCDREGFEHLVHDAVNDIIEWDIDVEDWEDNCVAADLFDAL